MSRQWAVLLFVACTQTAQAQHWIDEVRVGTERERYLRSLGLAAGAVTDVSRASAKRLRETRLPNWQPWPLGRDTLHAIRPLRPATTLAYNSGFPWMNVAVPAWLGRGFNFRGAVGGAATWGPLSARVEPAFGFAQNTSFTLEPGIGYLDAMRPFFIDLPQRFGASSLRELHLGDSFARVDAFGLTAGIAHERVMWGPGVEHALLFSAGAPAFPHVFAGTSDPVQTPVGAVHARLLYARLEQSDFAPGAPTDRRFGAGFFGTFTPRHTTITIAAARFYHRVWPDAFVAGDLFAPFGSLFYDAQSQAGQVPDNQLASLFASLRWPSARAEFYGEFGRNDRSADYRDFALEAEHNSAWLIGFLHAFGIDTIARRFWSVRYEAASGRISAIQLAGRPQSTFYEHSPITQGHTHRGLLLGTPLIDRSGGSEVAVDRWSPEGRIGGSILQRQMPPDNGVGMPADRMRTQWDLRVSALRFIGRSELGLTLGHVWDLNRFPGRDVGNLYLATSWRVGL